MSQSDTNVPPPALTDSGFKAPALSDILTGTIADLQAAFSGRLSFYDSSGNLETSRPQSQIAISEAAIISDMHAAFLAIMAGVDPQTSSGVMQDAIGRIYFMERRAGTPTIVTGLCRGAQGTVIPAGTVVQDTAGQTYTAMSSGTIGADGTVSIEFSNTQNGPIPCPAGTLTRLYQIISGWDSITNPVAGSIGQNVEDRTDFEARRQASVAANSIGQNASLMGAL
ncbi:MAG: baseplate J/gp47 family protein, partial [Bifidobacteriales bacterium]|nr:baseplate J/gp47 family protein [Bifidobacteriales bacterium]